MKVERIKELQPLIVKLQDFGVDCENDYRLQEHVCHKITIRLK